jgi:hypothetical protein
MTLLSGTSRFTQRRAAPASTRGDTAGNLILVAVVVVVAAMSWHGLVGFAHDELAIHSPLRFLVPVALDGAAVYAAFLALAAVIDGESAAGARMLVIGFAGASAYFNFVHAARHGGLTRGQFFAGMSIATVVLFDQWLRQLRRGRLRQVGVLPRMLPRFGWIRWVRFPSDTWRMWSAAVKDITPAAPAPAPAPVVVPRESAPAATRARSAPARHPGRPRALAVQVDLDADVRTLTTKAAQMDYALARVGVRTPGVVAKARDWLTEQGLTPMDRSSAYKRLARLTSRKAA